ncbi:hypothetical protein FRC03_012399 [Tulasnella sp. 419]|nr:hypothetical protein FRC03_012399 [Tulasnella sp. 419]
MYKIVVLGPLPPQHTMASPPAPDPSIQTKVCGTTTLTTSATNVHTETTSLAGPSLQASSLPPITSAHQSRPQSSVPYAYPTSSSVYPVQYNPYYVAAAAAAAYYQYPASAYRYHNQVSTSLSQPNIVSNPANTRPPPGNVAVAATMGLPMMSGPTKRPGHCDYNCSCSGIETIASYPTTCSISSSCSGPCGVWGWSHTFSVNSSIYIVASVYIVAPVAPIASVTNPSIPH